MQKYLYLLLFLLLPMFIMAGEFGLVINQLAELNNTKTDEASFEYTANIIPRFLFLIGGATDGKPAGSFYISAGIELKTADEFSFVPELLRTELSMWWGKFGIKAGRFGYSAPLPFIAEGLFDGLQLSHNSPAGQFKIGAWYTGFLYKKSANIAMTAYDRAVNDTPLDYGEFTGTYFAPKRFLASLDWEHLAVADILRLNAAVTAQIDLADKDEGQYHSQYFTIKARLPVKSFLFELGGCFSASQSEVDNTASFAGDFGIYLTLPTDYNSRLSFNAKYAGGETGGLGSFIPVTTKQTGDIFNGNMSALTVLSLNYDALYTDALGANISAKYFIRNDLTTFNTFPVTGEGDDGKLMGAEFFARLLWSPASDLYFNLGGGAFIPALGNHLTDANPVWQLELTAIFMIY